MVFDRGYSDCNWFERLTEQGIYFVIRMKRDIIYEVLEELPSARRSNVGRGCIIRLGS